MFTVWHIYNPPYSTFRRKEQPSVSLAFPPVGWHKTVLQFPHSTTVCAWLKTVVLHKKATVSQLTGHATGRGCKQENVEKEWGSCSHVEASRAFHIHEKAVGRLHKPLELVLALLSRRIRVQQVFFNL